MIVLDSIKVFKSFFGKQGITKSGIQYSVGCHKEISFSRERYLKNKYVLSVNMSLVLICTSYVQLSIVLLIKNLVYCSANELTYK